MTGASPSPAQVRPTGVTVMAIVCVAAAIVGVPGSLALRWWLDFNRRLLLSDPTVPDGLVTLLDSPLIDALPTVQIAAGGVLLVIGVGLWRLRRWARVAAEALAWVAAVGTVPGAVWWARSAPFDDASAFDALLGEMMRATMVINAVFYGALGLAGFGLAIWYLRRPPVRAAFGGPGLRR